MKEHYNQCEIFKKNLYPINLLFVISYGSGNLFINYWTFSLIKNSTYFAPISIWMSPCELLRPLLYQFVKKIYRKKNTHKNEFNLFVLMLIYWAIGRQRQSVLPDPLVTKKFLKNCYWEQGRPQNIDKFPSPYRQFYENRLKLQFQFQFFRKFHFFKQFNLV